MQRTDKARDEASNGYLTVLLIALLLALLVTCAPTVPAVSTSVPPTEAPTVTSLPTSTIVTPPSAYATQDAARQTAIAARATASPFPTAGPSTIQTGRPSKATARRNGLSLELWLTKDTYLAGEGGQAEVTLRNDGPETFYVVGAGGHPARPALLDQRGHEPAPWPWPSLPMIGWVFLPQELSPGQVLTGTLTFQVPPPDQAPAHSYVLWAEVSFARAMPDQPQGPDNLWLRLEAGPIPLQLLAPSAAQQLHAELQADSYGWMLRVTDAKGETPPGPFWGQLEATSRNGSLAQPLAHEPGGSWSASLDPYLTADGAQLALRAWVAAPGYVTAAATQTVPGVGSDSKPFYTGEPTDGQRYDTLEAAQAASPFPIYRPGFLPARTTLDGVQVDTWTLDEGYRAEATQIYRLRNDDWLELTQAASDPFWPDSGWGEARYDSEAEVIVIEQTLGYAIRHFGWWLLDWKCDDAGLELRAPVEALSLEELMAVAAGVRSPDGICPPAPTPAPPTAAAPPTATPAPPTQVPPPTPTKVLPGTLVWVSPSAGHQWGSRISGDTVVWVQEDPGTAPSTTDRVWVKSLSTGKAFAVSNGPGLQQYPDVSGDVVVWADTRNSSPYDERDIYGYRISSGQEFPIATGSNDQTNPAVSGSKVVWVELNNETRSIQGIDLNAGPFVVASAPVDGGSYYLAPAIDGDIVVYAEVKGNPKVPNTFSHVIYAYNLTTGTRITVGQGGEIGGQVAISGNRVAWASGSVHVFDLSTGQDMVVAGSCYYSTVDIDGNLVVWSEGTRIVGYDLSNGSAWLVSDSSSDQWGPSLSGTTVVWLSFATDEFANIALQEITDNLPPLTLVP